MAFVSLTHINQGQHHENKGLQQHDQNVEDSPHGSCQNMPNTQAYACAIKSGPCAAQQGDQHENEFTGKHVAEQPHAQRHRLGGVLDAIQKKVEWGQEQAGNSGRSEEHTSELQSLMRISYAVFCLKKKKQT